MLIVSPEYNSSITAVLKNAIDWASRREGDEKPLAAFVGKTAGLLSASNGALGGLRGLVHLRSILGNIQVLVLPEQFALSKAQEAFGEDGEMHDAAKKAQVTKVAERLVEVTGKIIS
jgi:chromate reductase, NAD(P)H dehydrogenase (quinone)